MIVKTEYFVGELYIPNLKGIAPNSDTLGNEKKLQDAIDKYEPKGLMLILGFELFNELKSNIDPETGVVLDSADQKWKDLVNGKDNYDGLVDLLTNYVFYFFANKDDVHYSGVGGVKENPKGAKTTSLRGKSIDAWRNFYELTVGEEVTGVVPTMIERNVGTGIVWTEVGVNGYKPLYTYLAENEDLFPNAVCGMIKNKNIFGI